MRRFVLMVVALAGCGFQVANQSTDAGVDGSTDAGPTVPTVAFAVESQTVTEQNVTLTAVVELSPASSQQVTVPFTVGGTATSTDASVTTASPLVFAAGATSATISIEIFEDSASEPNETLVITLGAPTGATLGASSSHTIQITDDDSTNTCYGAGNYSVCLATVSTNTLDLPTTIDTVSSTLCGALPLDWISQGQPDACFIYAGTIVVNGVVEVNGTRPLVLVGHSAIHLNGVLDVASHRSPMKTGPGSPGACGSPGQPGGTSSGAGGGPGGSFRTRGGNGGDGKSGTGTSAAPTTPQPTVLRAGCNGTAGGSGDSSAGAIGRGGGAVYLTSGTTITIASTGSINASGSAGSGGGDSSGGSGGGSGGMIKLSAPMIFVNGTILANGGGGASGADDDSDGADGSEANPMLASVAAAGGIRPPHSGGFGFAGTTNATVGGTASSASANAGGGGGGGGGGLVEINVSVLSSNISAGQIRTTP